MHRAWARSAQFGVYSVELLIIVGILVRRWGDDGLQCLDVGGAKARRIDLYSLRLELRGFGDGRR